MNGLVRLNASAFLGVDVGWVHPAADSDGNVYAWTVRRSPGFHLVEAGDVKIHTADGKTKIQPAYGPVTAAQALARGEAIARRGVALRVVTLAARTKRTLVLENWQDFARRKTAWVKMWDTIANVADERNVPITQVHRAYTSITCPRCGHKERGNRQTRGTFRCLLCDFNGHADVVAAMNIAAKGAGIFEIAPEACGNLVCDGGTAWAKGLCVRCYHWQIRHGALPSAVDVERRKVAPDLKRYRYSQFKRQLEERAKRREAATQERQRESYRTHDAWGDPVANAGESR